MNRTSITNSLSNSNRLSNNNIKMGIINSAVFSAGEPPKHGKQKGPKARQMRKPLLFMAAITIMGAAGIAGCKAKDPLACASQDDCAPNSYCYRNVCIIKRCTGDTMCPGRKCVNFQCVETESPDVPAKCAENNGGCEEKICDESSGTVVCKPIETFTITVTKTGNGTITSTPSGINCGTACSATYSYGASVNLIAQPAANQAFSGWGGSCSGAESCNLIMNAPQTVSATFTCIPETDTELCAETCGDVTDRCGRLRTCGGCPHPQECGVGSVKNKCACPAVIHSETLLTNWLPIPLSPPDTAYQELGNGVVLDTQTCLRWKKDYQREGETEMFTWEEAKSICSNLGDGWRLPTITELQSLVDYQKDSINSVFHIPEGPRSFWSSTGKDMSAWGVSFDNSMSHRAAKSYTNYVRCVR